MIIWLLQNNLKNVIFGKIVIWKIVTIILQAMFNLLSGLNMESYGTTANQARFKLIQNWLMDYLDFKIMKSHRNTYLFAIF